MSERFPKQFGKYVLLKSLARGGMGEIYLAVSGEADGLTKLCVIKKVITEKNDRAKANRFLDEAKVVLRLSHANLVSTFDAGNVGGELFIAMELVEGKDLREIWNRCVRTRTRIPLDVALYVARETARALSYVHGYGELRLVHRDVAPPNILLSYFGEVKLTDFGLARSALKQEHTAPGVVFGRASYLAPEQARGEVADARTDIYSLAIVLWELMTGQPYLQLAGLDPISALAMVRTPKAEPPSSRAPWISPELDAVVMRALAPDRAARYQAAEELRRALADVMARTAPRADAERVAEFLRGLYRDVIAEELRERERLLSETLPQFRGEGARASGTPRIGVAGAAPAESGASQAPDAAAEATAAQAADAAPAVDAAPAADAEPPAKVEAEARPPESEIRTVVAPFPEDPAGESLHASAMRARAGSQARQGSEDATGGDGPTHVWRKSAPADGNAGASETFVGRVIDNRYRIRRRIGEGGMGTVYAAEHVDIGKGVAVKILHRVYSGEKQLVERFRREARAASRVGHPHIVDVTDFGTTEDGCAYFVMEHLEGMDLADVLSHEGKLDPARAVRIAVQICQALQAAHNAHIIHRDLKPENIYLVPRDGQADFVKVLDFGIARSLTGDSRRLTNPGMAMGTPEYMSPEQALGRPADHRSDIYAVGALLYEMLMAAPPFQAASADAMLARKMRPLESLRPERPDVPPSLDALIAQTMDASPERRPQSMAQLEYELTKIVWGRPQAVAELLGFRDLAAPPLETPGARAATPPPPAAPPSRVPATRTPASMRPMDLEALLEADSPPPVAATALSVGPTPAPTQPLPPVMSRPSPRAVAVTAILPPSAAVVPRAPGPLAGASAPEAPRLPSSHEIAIAVDARLPPRRGPRAAVVALMLLVGGGAFVTWSWRHGHPEVEARIARFWGPTRAASSSGRGPSVVNQARTVAEASGVRAAATPSTSSASAVSAGAAEPPAPGTRAIVTTGAGVAAPPAARAGAARSGPEIVPTDSFGRARAALGAGNPDEAVSLLRPLAVSRPVTARPLLADALVASGWKDVHVYHWLSAARKARDALALTGTGPSRGAHALLGEALYATDDFTAALGEFTRALAETPGDARLKRRIIRSKRQLHGEPAAASAAAEPAAE